MGTKAAKKTAEITVETDRVLVIRRRRPIRGWCRECGCETDMLTLDEVGSVMSSGPPADRQVRRSWHFAEAEDGTGLVCLDSFLKSL